MARRTPQLAIKLDGPQVTPENVDAVRLLRLAQATFRLATKIADLEHLGLSLTGLAVIRGSCALASTPSNTTSARIAMTSALRVVSGERPAPRGAEQLAEEVRACVRELPARFSVSVELGAWKRAIRASPAAENVEWRWERTTLRARPTRVGGTGFQPSARLESRSEDGSFVVSVSEDDARVLGAHLYRDVDVDLELARSATGRIEQGRALRVMPLPTTDPAIAWRTWFEVNASEWEDVDDVGAELGRYD